MEQDVCTHPIIICCSRFKMKRYNRCRIFRRKSTKWAFILFICKAVCLPSKNTSVTNYHYNYKRITLMEVFNFKNSNGHYQHKSFCTYFFISAPSNSYLNAIEAKYMTTSHMMWKNWCLITFCTLGTTCKNHTSAATGLLLPWE